MRRYVLTIIRREAKNGDIFKSIQGCVRFQSIPDTVAQRGKVSVVKNVARLDSRGFTFSKCMLDSLYVPPA